MHWLAIPASSLCLAAVAAAAPGGFTDYGVGAKVAECRGVVTTRDKNGRNLVIAMALDESRLGYIVVTDIDKGETHQVPYPEGAGNSAVFASLMSRNGRLYTGAGRVLLEFEPTTEKWLFSGIPQPEAGCFVGQAIADGPDGLIYGGTCPNSHLVSYDPQTQAMRDYGRLDPQESYFSYLAFDDAGWAYAGIGTARWNIVAYNLKTGERRQILPEEERKTGTASVYTGADGKVYGTAGACWRLFEGRGEKIDREAAAAPRPVGSIGWGQSRGTFADGRRLVSYDLPGKWLAVEDPKTKERKRLTFDYDAGGVLVTSLGEGPQGVVYGSTCHPMHLLKIDPRAGKMEDLGPIPTVGGGNFCAIAAQGNQVIGAQYSAGRLWAYDVTQPWNPAGDNPNPRVLAQWHDDVCRPRTALAHPDGRHVMMGGFAGYGLCGGGIGIVDLQSGEATLLSAEKDLLPSHSPITLKALPNGDLVGGTSIEAPGGGHKAATVAELFIVDWKARKLSFRAPLLPGAGDIISIQVGKDGLVYGLAANSTLFAFDPQAKRLLRQESLSAYGGVPRHALQVAPDGTLYAMLSKAIVRIDPETLRHEKVADTPVPVTAGGALLDRVLYFASGARLWSYRLP